MLEIGRGYGLSLEDGTLAASTVTLPYGAAFAWVSMVLVAPEHAAAAMRHACCGGHSRIFRRARAAVLDATPAGHEVYAEEGFRDTWGFQAVRPRCLQDEWRRRYGGSPTAGATRLVTHPGT
jgi:hypothetical protein